MDVFVTTPEVPRRLCLEKGTTHPVVVGDLVRDWGQLDKKLAIVPYGFDHALLPLEPTSAWVRYLWPNRRLLQSITGFGRETRLQAGEEWWSWYRWVAGRYQLPLSIAFAEVATHNHFVLDRGRKVFQH